MTSKTVLLAETDPALRDLISLGLQRQGYVVTTAQSRDDILAGFQGEPPHYLLLNLLLPNANGIDILKMLQEKHLLMATIVIVITSMGFPEVVENAIQAGATDFVVKPFPIEVLLEKLENLF